MKTANNSGLDRHVSEKLATSGFRLTGQRRHVYEVLSLKLDHPTAEEVFIRAKKQMADISLATVYNCLDALVQSGLVRQVQLERGATRFCSNMQEHAHFHCEKCGAVFDVALEANSAAMPKPKGFKVDHYEIAVHGLCADCAKRK